MDYLKEQKGIFCQYHPHHKVSFIKISQENIVELRCDECILNECSQKDLISIQTIRLCSENHVFSNWPPLNNNNLLKDLKASLKTNSQIIEQIEFQFDKISKEITSYLASEKNKMILQVINLSEKVNEIQQSYYNIFDINKLKQLVNLNQENIQNQIYELKSFVSQYLEQKDENATILQEYLNTIYNEQLYQFDFSKLKKTNQEYIDNLIEQIRQILPFKQSDHIYQLFGKLINSNSNIIEYKEDLQKISIKKIQLNGGCQVYLNYNLTKDKKYVVRFKFNDEGGDCFNIGLLSASNLSKDLSSSHLAKAFGEFYLQYSSKIVKGSHFYLLKKDLIVEMRIYLKEQKLQFLDYPDQVNINEINDEHTLDQNDIYYLAVQFISNSNYKTSIDLIYFEEVQY